MEELSLEEQHWGNSVETGRDDDDDDGDGEGKMLMHLDVAARTSAKEIEFTSTSIVTTTSLSLLTFTSPAQIPQLPIYITFFSPSSSFLSILSPFNIFPTQQNEYPISNHISHFTLHTSHITPDPSQQASPSNFQHFNTQPIQSPLHHFHF